MKIRKRWTMFSRSLAGKPRFSTIMVNIDRDILLKIRAMAKFKGMSLNDFVVSILIARIKEWEAIGAIGGAAAAAAAEVRATNEQSSLSA